MSSKELVHEPVDGERFHILLYCRSKDIIFFLQVLGRQEADYIIRNISDVGYECNMLVWRCFESNWIQVYTSALKSFNSIEFRTSRTGAICYQILEVNSCQGNAAQDVAVCFNFMARARMPQAKICLRFFLLVKPMA